MCTRTLSLVYGCVMHRLLAFAEQEITFSCFIVHVKLSKTCIMVVIALVGATGPSGLEVVKEALSRGLTVRAVVRDPSKITIENPNLEVSAGTRLWID